MPRCVDKRDGNSPLDALRWSQASEICPAGVFILPPILMTRFDQIFHIYFLLNVCSGHCPPCYGVCRLDC